MAVADDVVLDGFPSDGPASSNNQLAEVRAKAVPPRMRESLLSGRAVEVEADSEVPPRAETVGEFVVAVVARICV